MFRLTLTIVLIAANASIAVAQPEGEALEPRQRWAKPARAVVDESHARGIVYVKFADDAPLAMRDARPTARLDRASRAAIDALPIAGWRPVYDLPEDRLDHMRTNAQRTLGRALADMTTEFFAIIDNNADAASIVDAFNALDIVELALPMPKPVAPPLPPDFEPNQGYLITAPTGVGAVHAWAEFGTRGAGVSIADLEYTFNMSHADLPRIQLVGVTPADPGFGPDHGTAVLGLLAALNNGWGTTGLAAESQIYFAGTYDGQVWNIASALLAATNAMQPGDIILIEQQFVGPNGQFVPVEWFPPWHNAIVTAVGNGMVVVMAAGNGGQNLDDPIFSQGNGGHWPFLPQNDSGAIIVGAGASSAGFGNTTTPRSRLSFSTYGSRVNLQGWGQGVWTTGYGAAYSAEGPTLQYTSTFGGTSSASPVVAGACALVQSVYKARNSGATLTSHQMRSLLMSTGMPQQDGANPATQNIGPLPDIEAAITHITPAAVCVGDSNGDNIVNFADLSATLSVFGQSGAGIACDFDHDGDVDFIDLNAVLSNFGSACPE
jgi:hypothetical protein